MKAKIKFLTLLIITTFFSCVKDLDGPVTIDDVITLRVEPGNSGSDTINLPADGYSTFRLNVKLGKKCDDKKSIIFYASNGQLMSYLGAAPSNNISQTAVNKEASVLLKSSTIPEKGVYVTAKVEEYFVKKYVNFVPSQPDTFFVKPESFFTTSDKINIDVELLRNEGFVSSQVPVYFSCQVLDSPDLQVIIDPYKYTDNSSKSSPLQVRATLQKVNDKTGTVRVTIECKNNGQVSRQKKIDVKFQ